MSEQEKRNEETWYFPPMRFDNKLSFFVFSSLVYFFLLKTLLNFCFVCMRNEKKTFYGEENGEDFT